MGERSGAPRASALHQSSFRNLRLRFNYRSQMSQLTVTHPRGIVRRVPLMLSVNGGLVPSMSLELASRALETQPKVTSAGVEIAGYTVASLVPKAITLNFDGGSGDIPAYSLADLLSCVDKRDTDFFRRNFGGKVVLFGSKLALEDLKMTSKRFASAPRSTTSQRCVLSAPAEAPPAHGLSMECSFRPRLSTTC